jgi:hypothetical protein
MSETERTLNHSGQFGTDTSDASLGELFSEITTDLSTLIRQEIELAKAEVKTEAVKAGKGAGMLGGAGFAAYMLIVFGSLSLALAIGSQIGYGWGALIVAVLWAVIGAVLAVSGRHQLRSVNPKPELTAETIKEDAQWARHPRS